jgi:hypothetical protein
MAQIPEQLFQQLLPRAAAWAQHQEGIMLRHEAALVLSPQGQETARRAGVQRPDAVRLLPVQQIPLSERVTFGMLPAALFALLPSCPSSIIPSSLALGRAANRLLPKKWIK